MRWPSEFNHDIHEMFLWGFACPAVFWNMYL